jgi:hypothetical protein
MKALFYSYGDSAGITPDFPFNSDYSETKNSAKIRIEIRNKKYKIRNKEV